MMTFDGDQADRNLVLGLMLVRNEVDIIAITILHHLHHGIDRFLVVDDGSTDGTDRVLTALSASGRVEWISRPTSSTSLDQAAITTELAQEAYLRGAGWVLPIDADEFWCASEGTIRDVVERSSAGALRVPVVHFIQRRDVLVASPRSLLFATRRTSEPTHIFWKARGRFGRRDVAFVEGSFDPKWISRATLTLDIAVGNHFVAGAAGPMETTPEVTCLHVPLRSREKLRAKMVDLAPRKKRSNVPLSWHLERWRRLGEPGLDEEWRANSYENGHIDVYGTPHPTVEDLRLRQAIEPWLDEAELITAAALGAESDAPQRFTPPEANVEWRKGEALQARADYVNLPDHESIDEEAMWLVDRQWHDIIALYTELQKQRIRVADLETEMMQYRLSRLLGPIRVFWRCRQYMHERGWERGAASARKHERPFRWSFHRHDPRMPPNREKE